MPYTGVDLYNSIRFRTYQGRAGAYLSIDRANEIIRSGRVKLLEDDWNKIVTQQSKDEISPLIKTGKLFTPNNNKVLLKPLVIASAQIQANPNITFDRPHNLIAATPIVITGITGISGVVTTYTIVNAYTIHLTGYTSTGTYVANSGYAVSDGYIIDDYYHLLAVQLQCKQVVSSVLSRTFNNTKFVLTIPSGNNIRTGEYLFFAANPSDEGGVAYVKKITYNKIQLFSDATLTTPMTSANSDYYLVGWNISRYLYRYADPLNSDQKIDTYNSTAYFPLSEVTENELSIETYKPYSTQLDTSVTQLAYSVDYVRTLPEIDLTDSAYDIYQIHNANFYDRLIEYAALKFQAVTSAGEDVQITEVIGGFKE